MRALALVLALASVAQAEQGHGSLRELNALGKLLGPKGAIAASDLERLVDVGEGVALRDGARRPTPAAITYAAAIEQALSAGTMKGERPKAVLAELALSLAPLAGPLAHEHAVAFLPELIASSGLAAKDAKPRPELPTELLEVGRWAARTVEKLAIDLPARAPVYRVRLELVSGHWAQAADRARKQLAGPRGTDPRWQAWAGAALLGAGKAKDAAPYLAAARGSGGEAATIARGALDRATFEGRAEAAAQALKTAGASVVVPSQGGRPSTIPAACLSFAGDPKTAAPALASAAVVACSQLRFAERSDDFLRVAVRYAPAGAEGAPLRAAHALLVLLNRDPKRPPSAAERTAARDRYLADLALLDGEQPTKHVLALLGHVGASERPSAWTPAGDAEGTLLTALDRESGCEAASFALRAMAVRNNPAAITRLLDATMTRCTGAAGAAAVADAIPLQLQLTYDSSAPASETTTARTAEIARARPDDAEAIAAHADAIALKALSGKRTGAPLEAALSRYEDAIARTSPAAEPAARQRLESNAAFLCIQLAQLAGDAAKPRRARFYQRAAQHLRLAIAFGEAPSVMSVRAQWDLDTGSGQATAAPDLSRFPPTPARARAACNLARLASAQGDLVHAKELVAMATPVSSERSEKVPELLVETVGLLEAVIDGRGLRPEVALHTHLWLAPACDPTTVTLTKTARP